MLENLLVTIQKKITIAQNKIMPDIYPPLYNYSKYVIKFANQKFLQNKKYHIII